MPLLPPSTKTPAQAVQALQSALTGLYEAREAAAIVRQLMADVTGWPPHELMLRRHEAFTPGVKSRLNKLADRLLRGEPLQYVLEHTWFDGLRLAVGQGVLIPRPETEELVVWIADTLTAATLGAGLDVGAGSGAITLALAKRLPRLRMTALDISTAALTYVQRNSKDLDIPVQWVQQDVLAAGKDTWSGLTLLVSNPPYVPVHERETLHANVRDYEPHTALFVPDDDAILFYRHLAQMGRHWLAPGGWLFFELHPPTADEVLALVTELGYANASIILDLQDRKRMLRARNNSQLTANS